MERLDAIVAGIGVMVVAVALGGVVALGPSAAGSFQVVFVEQRTPLEAQDGAFTGDASVEVPFDLSAQNLTRLEVTVRVVGNGPRTTADTLTITLAGPDGAEETQTAQLGPGGPGEASVTFERAFAALPGPQAVQANNEAAAVAAATVPPAAGNATGTWTVTVAAASGGPAPLHVESHTVTVEAVAFGFRGVVQPEIVNPR